MSLDPHTWFRSGFLLIPIVPSPGDTRLGLFIDESIGLVQIQKEGGIALVTLELFVRPSDRKSMQLSELTREPEVIRKLQEEEDADRGAGA